MPKIDLANVPVKTGSAYPGALSAKMDGRIQQRVGDAGGITQFGANLVTLAPGALSSLRHWHENQDEFLVMVSGELTLVDDNGDTPMCAGDCAAFPAGDDNGHHLINKSDKDGQFLVVGTHTDIETGWYSDEDMKVTADNDGFKFSRKDGTPL